MITLQYLLGLSKGLHHIHRFGFGHCDLKPENILFTLLPEDFNQSPPDHQLELLLKSEPVIIDFGMATKFGDKPSGGTPMYHPPEGIIIISESFDVFALGCIFYQFISGGQHPFDKFSEENWKWSHEIPSPGYPLKKEGNMVLRYRIEKTVFSKSIEEDFQELIRMMMHPNREERPTLPRIINFLNEKILLLKKK